MAALATGGGLGATASLINDVSFPYGTTGSRLVDTSWTWAAEVAEVASLLVEQGWAWAGPAVFRWWIYAKEEISPSSARTTAAAAAPSPLMVRSSPEPWAFLPALVASGICSA